MKITCDRCDKTYNEIDGGYVVQKNKNLCDICWKEYSEMVKRHYQEVNKWWEGKNGNDSKSKP